jgi:hypothetical protein
MPMSMLLTSRLGVLNRGVRKIAPWEGIADTFAIVLRRLRSAYLVHWFGTGIPISGIDLRVAIVNMADLRARWQAIGGDRPPRPRPAVGPNLTEPLFGWTGMLVGAFASPINSMLLGAALARLMPRWWTILLGATNWLTFGLLGTAVLGAAATIGGLGLAWGMLAFGISGQAGPMYDLLGAVTEIAAPLERLWQQLIGPRASVRNPVLRQALLLGDAVAALVAQLLGAFAVLIERVAPLLDPIRIGLFAAVGIVTELGLAIGFVLGQIIDVASWLISGYASPASIVSLLSGGLSTIFRTIGRRMAGLWTRLSDAFSVFAARASAAASTWWRTAEPFVRSQTIDHPTVAFVRSFIGGVEVAAGWRRRVASPSRPSAPASPPGPISRYVRRKVIEALHIPTTVPRLPTLPTLPSLPSADTFGALAGQLGDLPFAPNPLALDAAARAALDRARRPPSVFADQAAQLARQADAAGRARAVEVATYLSLADRIVAPAAAAQVRRLENLLSTIDAAIRPSRTLPVRDLPPPTALRPVIRTLRVRADGATRETLDGWVREVRRRLDAEPYPLPAGA